MDRLPIEILTIIVDNLASQDDYAARDDFKDLRLTCKRLNDLATPHLFKTLPLWLGRQSLSNLESASRHPSISKCVNGIVFSPIIFSSEFSTHSGGFTETTAQRLREETTERFYALPSGPPSDLEEHVDRYMKSWQRYHDDSRTLFSQDGPESVPQTLTRIFTSLPNLSSVEVDCEARTIGAAEIEAAFGRTFGVEFGRAGSLTTKIIFDALASSEKSLRRFAASQDGYANLSSDNAQDTTTRTRRTQRLDFSLQDGHAIGYALPRAVSNDSQGMREGPLFSKLECLELLNLALVLVTHDRPSTGWALEKIVSANKDTLRNFHLYGSPDFITMGGVIEIYRAFPVGQALPNLESLGLGLCTITTEMMVGLLGSCAPRIRKVLLDQIDFPQGEDSWTDMLARLRMTRYPNLKEFTVFPTQIDERYEIHQFIQGVRIDNPGADIDLACKDLRRRPPWRSWW